MLIWYLILLEVVNGIKDWVRFCRKLEILMVCLFSLSIFILILERFSNWLISFNKWFVFCCIMLIFFFGILVGCWWSGVKIRFSGVWNLCDILVKKWDFILFICLICVVFCFSFSCWCFSFSCWLFCFSL